MLYRFFLNSLHGDPVINKIIMFEVACANQRSELQINGIIVQSDVSACSVSFLALHCIAL